MRQKLPNIILIVFLGVFFGAILTSANSSSTHRKLAKSTAAKLTKEFSGKISVIDGDSIRVEGKEVRLIGIDAPEYKQKCFNKSDQEYYCGKLSHKFLVKLANKKTAKCFYNEKDIYKRYLAECFIDQISINDQILKNGMAVIYDYGQASKEKIALEKSAKNNHLGIWQGAFQLPKTYRKANRRK